MTPEARLSLENQIRTILPASSAEALLSLWARRAHPEEAGLDRVLLAAAVLMLGADRPSPAAALSAAQGLAGSAAGASLAHLAEALFALSGASALSPAYRSIMAGAVQAAAEALQACADHIHFHTENRFPD
jgi:hypothetical protein